ncbi:MAG: cyclic nucleotide-binding domain-containing protein [Ilumatobacter sp.]|uniref:cyclic nucleotide-binding domain-containing protein n=1 Tax=Ilumatobacter sp. TaxID=1967498 RepID=UPI003919CFCB
MAANGESASSRRAAVRRVVANRRLRSALRGFGGFSLAEYGGWLAIMLVAYERGGAGEAGIVAVLLLLPAAVASPLIATLGDLAARERVLTLGFLTTAALLGATGVAVVAEAPAVVIYGLAVLFSMSIMFARPAMGALIPVEARSADELTAANVAVGFVGTAGALAGPALAALIVIEGTPGQALLVLAGLAGVAGLSTIGAGTSAQPEATDDDPDLGSPLRAMADGFQTLRSDARISSLVVSISATSVLIGAVDVGAVILALDVLGDDESVAGLLTTMFGLGAVLGSVGSVALVGRQRLARTLTASVGAAGASLAIVGASSILVLTVVLLVVAGLAVSLAEVAARTMMQGLTSDDTLSRLFGVLEGTQALGLAAGGFAVSMATVAFGPTAAFAGVAGAVAVVAMTTWRRLASIDRERHVAPLPLYDLLRSTAVFGALPPYVIEQLSQRFHLTHHEAGSSMLRRGGRGRHVGVIDSGSVTVTLDDGATVERGRGSIVGEIAVLRNAERSADVDAGPDGADVYWIDGVAFLDAISRVRRSHARAEAEASRRLGETA